MYLFDMKYILCILVLILLLDYVMLMLINKKMYLDAFSVINNGPIIINNRTWIAGSITYLLLALIIYFFIIKQKLNITYAIILGFLVYGIYNGTNLATINLYNTKIAILDSLWGGLLFGIVTFISRYLDI
jgi:uncharacterized membrane protein